MKFRSIQVTFCQTVYDITKEGAEAWGRMEIGGIVSKYDGLTLALPLLTLR